MRSLYLIILFILGGLLQTGRVLYRSCPGRLCDETKIAFFVLLLAFVAMVFVPPLIKYRSKLTVASLAKTADHLFIGSLAAVWRAGRKTKGMSSNLAKRVRDRADPPPE